MLWRSWSGAAALLTELWAMNSFLCFMVKEGGRGWFLVFKWESHNRPHCSAYLFNLTVLSCCHHWTCKLFLFCRPLWLLEFLCWDEIVSTNIRSTKLLFLLSVEEMVKILLLFSWFFWWFGGGRGNFFFYFESFLSLSFSWELPF